MSYNASILFDLNGLAGTISGLTLKYALVTKNTGNSGFTIDTTFRDLATDEFNSAAVYIPRSQATLDGFSGFLVPYVGTLGVASDFSGVTVYKCFITLAPQETENADVKTSSITGITIRSNTAQAGASGTITLDASASATNNLYRGEWIVLTGGTGVGQVRLITAYVGSTKVATVLPAWVTTPDNTSTFTIIPAAGVDVEQWLTTTPNALSGGKVDAVVAGLGGSGARAVTITVNDGSTALQNTTVRMSEGSNTYTATTNVSGIATFSLDDATYTVTITKAGYSFTPTTLAVSATTAHTYSMTAISIPGSSSPSQSNCYLYTYDGPGAILGSVTITFKRANDIGTDGLSFGGTEFTATSDVNGLLQIDLTRLGAFVGKRGANGRLVAFVVTDTSTFQLPEILGTETN